MNRSLIEIDWTVPYSIPEQLAYATSWQSSHVTIAGATVPHFAFDAAFPHAWSALPRAGSTVGTAADRFKSVTLNCKLGTPAPHILLRPEIRWDKASMAPPAF